MRAFASCLFLALAATLAPVPGAAQSTVYAVTYGTRDLGTWTTMTLGRNATGTYDGTTFDSSKGPGFATVTLTRALTAADRTALWPSLTERNVRLVVRQMRGAKLAGTIACSVATPSDSAANGDPGKGTYALTFACKAISIS